jgi:uncharacterized protein DUF3631
VAARAACVELYGGRQLEDESIGVQLLSDIRDVFGTEDRVTSGELLERLNALEESPWCDWFGKPLTHRGLAKLLDRYRIKSRNVRLPDGKTPKGFLRAEFEGAWARYLAPHPPQCHNPHSAAENGESESATSGSVWRIENSRNPAPGAGCGGVADRGPSEGGNAVLGCVCRTPARSPRADGPDVCQTCKQPIRGTA